MKIVLLAGLLPCAILLYLIYQKDTIEKEPTNLLVKLILLGCASAIPAIILEMVGGYALSALGVQDGTMAFYLLENFLVVALAEEGCKKFMLRIGSWNDPAFNYVFDGVVYAVCVTLGFAGLENVGYILSYGIEVALIRALAAIPLHCICGIFMGHAYGLEKAAALRGQTKDASIYRVMSLLSPVLIHGFYDFAASVGDEIFLYIWLAFIVVIDIFAIRAVLRYSREDRPI